MIKIIHLAMTTMGHVVKFPDSTSMSTNKRHSSRPCYESTELIDEDDQSLEDKCDLNASITSKKRKYDFNDEEIIGNGSPDDNTMEVPNSISSSAHGRDSPRLCYQSTKLVDEDDQSLEDELDFDANIATKKNKYTHGECVQSNINIEGSKRKIKEIYEQKWRQKFDELCEFKRQHGHCDVSTKYIENRKLGFWVIVQRCAYKKKLQGKPSRITEERIEALEKIGFQWQSYNLWWERYDELCEYKRQHGNCLVSQTGSLGWWVAWQRKIYKEKCEGKPTRLSEEKIAALDKIDFEWGEIHDARWQELYDELLKFKQQRGHCNVSKRNNVRLNRWCYKQRQEYKSECEGKPSTLTKERIAMLENIGFNWGTYTRYRTQWHERYDELRMFMQQYGNCNISKEKHRLLWLWAEKQKKAYKAKCEGKVSTMNEERIAALNKIGFQWWGERDDLQMQDRCEELVNFEQQHGHFDEPYDLQLQNRCEELLKFKQHHGHFDVPFDEEHKVLAPWVCYQRTEYRKKFEGRRHDISEKYIAALNEIGFEWYTELNDEPKWQQRYDELWYFKQTYGHCNVSKAHREHKQLYTWVIKQRQKYKNKCESKSSTLTEEHIALMENIGFRWTLK